MRRLPSPPVPDLARMQAETSSEARAWMKDYYEGQGCPWNYRSGTKAIKVAYKGIHRLDLLAAAAAQEKNKQSKKSNGEIIGLAAPLAFGRKTQVFDLPPRRFPFGRDRYAAYRIPFFFVEDGIVKLYFLQPRKDNGPSFDELGMIGAIHQKYLLQTEFYGLPADVEYVDLTADPDTGFRKLNSYKLSDLQLWPEKRVTDRLTLAAEAIEFLEREGTVKSRRRSRSAEPEMPLFD